jgi:sugar/nucleoside kinase (ribokinase family)
MARQARIVSSAKLRGGANIWTQIDSPWQDKAAQEPTEEAALLCEVDAVLPSEADLDDFLPGATRPAATQALLSAGARRVVLKRGAEGCDVYGHDGRAVHIPTVAVDVVDLTGAGDAFCGGFLAGICTTGDVVVAARQGAVSASFAIERRGIEGLTRADRREAADRLASIT